MKAIIDGKRYDTDTATEVASWNTGGSMGDMNYCGETLYRTPKGNWFLYGEGGARSQYAVEDSPGWTAPGGKLIGMTADEAYNWLQEHTQTDALEQYFADRVQDA